MRFSDKVVVVTGASRGIGRAIALGFAREGADLVLAARSTEASVDRFQLPGTILEVAEEVRALGRRALPVRTDVSLPGDAEEMARRAAREVGRIDVLINNAAFTNVTPTVFWEMTEEQCEAEIETTFKGVLNCCRAVIPGMLRRQSGKIVNVTSAGARIPAPFMSIYSSCKEAVAQFSRCIAHELAPRGIAVNCVAPGFIDTDLLVPLFGQALIDQQMAGAPLQRMADPDEVARVVLFMASDDASYVVGQQLLVDGGWARC